MATADSATTPDQVVEAAPEELNQWKRGFTPQAEIWNGRMAMVGLSVGLSVLLIARLAGKV
ncbi:MAG: high light inducible protein [Vulcanococcus sp.]